MFNICVILLSLQKIKLMLISRFLSVAPVLSVEWSGCMSILEIERLTESDTEGNNTGNI